MEGKAKVCVSRAIIVDLRRRGSQRHDLMSKKAKVCVYRAMIVDLSGI